MYKKQDLYYCEHCRQAFKGNAQCNEKVKLIGSVWTLIASEEIPINV